MTINVVCPHCETRLNLQKELLGKSIRCPICLDIFLVEETAAPAVAGEPTTDEKPPVDDKPVVARTDAPEPSYKTGTLVDFIQVLPGEAVPPAARKKKPEPIHRPIERTEPREPAAPAPTEVAWSPGIEPPGFTSVPDPPPRVAEPPLPIEKPPLEAAPVEFKWTEATDPFAETPAPPPTLTPPPKTVPAKADPVARRPRKKRSRLAVLIVLVAVIAGGLGLGGYFYNRHLEATPERLYTKAKKEYEAKNYEPARKLFDELATEHQDSPYTAEAKFFRELCALRGAVYSVTVRSDPANAQAQLKKFLTAIDDPVLQPFAEPKKFQVDIWETVLKLTEDVTGKGGDLFNRDKPDDALPWHQQAAELGKVVERFHPKDLDRENIYAQINGLMTKIENARGRLILLAELKTILADPDDSQIVDARRRIDEAGYAGDSAFIQVLNDAERLLSGKVVYERDNPPIPSNRDRAVESTSLLFAPRLDRPKSQPPSRSAPTTFFALARGILYALDSRDGSVRWATRLGIDGDISPLVVPGTDLHPDMVLLVENDGTRTSLCARAARDGVALWRQILPGPCLAEPILVGQRVYVPLRERPTVKGERARRDEVGVILEIEIASGSRIGRLALGRPLGSGLVLRPGTSHLYCPAESQGIYVFDVDKIGPDGARLDPIFLGMLPTGHAAGSLRGRPVMTSTEGEVPGYLILALAAGLDAMQLRAFALAAPDQTPALIGERPNTIPLPGWTNFPAYCDSEKLALVTDRGEFALFGLNQSGNFDAPIFVLPPKPYNIPDVSQPIRGQVIHADEQSFLFLARGALHQIRIGFDATLGLKLVTRGKPLLLGEPLQASQIDPAGDTAFVLTQASGSASCRATALELKTVGVRWQRVLGLIPADEPIRLGARILQMDQDGGLHLFDLATFAERSQTEWLMDERWLVAPPLATVTGIGYLLRGKDESTVHAFLPVRALDGARLAIRTYDLNRGLIEKSVPLPAALAGRPSLSGRYVLIPLANGILYRVPLDQNKPLEAGPTWRGERVDPRSTCYLLAPNGDEFIASDGGKVLVRWRWPADKDVFTRQASLNLSERLAAAPILLEDGTMLVADINSLITHWDASRWPTNAQPIRAWRPSDQGKIPPGRLTAGPFRDRDADGKTRILYTIAGRHLVAIDPAVNQPLWVLPNAAWLEEGRGLLGGPQRRGNQWVLTFRTGLIVRVDADTGKLIGEPIRLKAQQAPAAPAQVLDESTLLVPLADGAALLVPLEANARLPFQFFPLPPFGWPLPIPVP